MSHESHLWSIVSESSLIGPTRVEICETVATLS
jgi:hypothetical protein